MIDQLKAHISRGFELGTPQDQQLARFRKACGVSGMRQKITARDRVWHTEMIRRAEAQMHREQIIGHDASHTAPSLPDKR
jgi:hypothetical protein